MYLVTKTEMQNIDRNAIEKICIPGHILMENAGIKIFDVLKKLYLSSLNNIDPSEVKICILSGTGNNGGDGLVLARHLLNNNYKPAIAIIGSPLKMSKETLINYKILKNLKAKILIIEKTSSLSNLKQIIKDSNILIDALLGTGLSRQVEGLTGDVIKLINNSGKKVISVDIPSGIDADTGEILGTAVKACHTITLALPKRGLFLFPGNDYSGKISVVDISIPYGMINEKINTNIFLRGEASKLLPARPKQAHKGNFGKILIIGGSKDYIGAPVLASEAALKTGSGLVYTAMPECVYSIMAKKFREQIPISLPETEKGTIGHEALFIIMEKIKNLKIDCLAIGPGLSLHKKTSEFVKLLIKSVNVPVVIDADAINALSEDPIILKNISAPIILTPHTGELARLLNIKIENIEKNRIKTVEDFTKSYPCVLVLKGPHTLSGYKKNIFMNITGNSGMATAGSGDVLTGMIASLAGQGLNIFDAAKLAVFLHGSAGDIAGNKKNKISITATDILNNISYAISELIKYSPSAKDNTYSLGDVVDIPSYYNI